MKSSQEIELKLDASPKSFARLANGTFLKSLGTVEPTKSKSSTLVSVYFDTDTLKLRRNGVLLRVRRDGDQRVQTIKTERGAGGSVMQRQEWERKVSSDEPNLKAARGTSLEPVLTRKVRRSLKPLFETRVERTIYPVQRGKSLIEVTLDRGKIDTGREASSVMEVELELKRGLPRDLFDLARKLAMRTPIELALRSKADRGYQLVTGEKAEPIKAVSPSLSAESTTEEAFQAIARACLYQLVANLPVVRNGDPDGLHQTRVAIRRIRAAISLFAEILKGEQTQAIKKELKWATGELGKARELDVFMTRVVKPAINERSTVAGMPELADDLERRRIRALDHVCAALGSPRFRMLLVDLAAWIEAGEWKQHEDTLTRARGKQPIMDFAVGQFHRRWRKLLRWGKRLEELDPSRRHKLRIEAKTLRYMSEFLARALVNKKALQRHQTFVKRLEKLQGCLGELNDISVHAELTARLVNGPGRLESRPDTKTAFAAGRLTGREEARRRPVLARAHRAFNRLAAGKPFW